MEFISTITLLFKYTEVSDMLVNSKHSSIHWLLNYYHSLQFTVVIGRNTPTLRIVVTKGRMTKVYWPEDMIIGSRW